MSRKLPFDEDLASVADDRSRAIDVEDLTQVSNAERTHVIDVEICPHVRATLQAEADARGMTLEEYVRGLALTIAAVTNIGGSASGGGKA